MKILNVNFSIDPRTGGGTAERTYQLTRFLLKNNIDCTVLAMQLAVLPNKIATTLQGAKIILLPFINRRFYIPKISLKKLQALVKEADIIHLIGHWSVLNALVYYFAKKFNKPYVFCPAGSLPAYGRSLLLKKIYNQIIGHAIIKNAARCIAITQDEQLLLEKYGIAKNNIALIPNGVYPDDLVLNRQTDFLKKIKLATKKYILFLGRLNYIKGPDLLLQAFTAIANELPEFDLVFAGGDEGMLAQLQKLTQDFSLQNRVHFLGYLDREEKAQVYQQATLLVVPSRHEAMSIVVLESGILGKPVLMTDQCGFVDVEQIKGGLIVPVSAQDLEQGLRRLLFSCDELAKMGENLKNHILAQYTWNAQVLKLITLYKQILSVDYT